MTLTKEKCGVSCACSLGECPYAEDYYRENTVNRRTSINETVATNAATVQKKLTSAVEALRDIAAMGKKAGSESAKNWLLSHGYALEEGRYVPGKGFES